MTANRRIFLNIVATYGRSLYALACGLITARWVYNALGAVDYGLMGLIGGLTAFIAFINSILAVAVGRFYAFAIGREQIKGNERNGIEECRQWFNVAVVFHTIIPIVLMTVGYPIGVWAIRNFLTIPVDRVDDCIWLFRFACFGCMWSMMAVPYNAMYGAHQYIAELTIYSFATTTLNVFFLCYVVSHPGYWLVRIAFWNFLLGIMPAMIITIRGYIIFPECRFNFKYMRSVRHLKEMGAFAGWYTFGMVGNLCRYQCLPVLVNKYFGPAQNAAVNIANTVAGHTTTLSGSLVGAFSPALTSAIGAGRMDDAITFMHRICKFGTLLILLFAIPLSVEVKEVMRIWLKMPPPASAWLAVGIMVSLVLEGLTTGHWIAISANGKIALYQVLVGCVFILTLPICWLMMAGGMSIYSVAYSMCITLSMVVVVRIVMVRYYLGVSPKYWFVQVLLPTLASVAGAIMAGLIPRLFMGPSLIRIVISTIFCEMALVALIWSLMLDATERIYLMRKVKNVLKIGA